VVAQSGKRGGGHTVVEHGEKGGGTWWQGMVRGGQARQL
jgi:cation diffusion facilitator CzcD-associated flavoprotein CzcO